MTYRPINIQTGSIWHLNVRRGHHWCSVNHRVTIIFVCMGNGKGYVKQHSKLITFENFLIQL